MISKSFNSRRQLEDLPYKTSSKSQSILPPKGGFSRIQTTTDEEDTHDDLNSSLNSDHNNAY